MRAVCNNKLQRFYTRQSRRGASPPLYRPRTRSSATPALPLIAAPFRGLGIGKRVPDPRLRHLIARVKVVSEGLNHMVSRDADVSRSALDYRENRSKHAANCTNLLSGGVFGRRYGVEVAK